MKEGSNKFLITLIAGLMFIFGGTTVLCAQDTQESASDEFTLEEITVTAQKRTENQQKVPIAMDVISGDTLAESGKDNINDILMNQSNAIINMSSSGMKVSLRGLAETESSQYNMRMSTPTVAINVDGALNNGGNAGQNLYDLERVEVLYGPQSTLYGSNSPGGIVNIVTAAPKTDRYSASGSVEYGSYKKRSYQGTVNAPIINDKLAMRLAAQKSNQGTWIDGGDSSSKNTSARLKTLYQATDNLSATLTGSWSVASNGGQMGGGVTPFDYQDGHYYDGTKVTNPWTESSSVFVGGGPGDSVADPMKGNQRSKGVSAEVSWDTVYGGISLVPSYNKNYSKQVTNSATFTDRSAGPGGTTVKNLREESLNSTSQKNAELRVTSPKDFFLTYILGATYYKSERQNKNTYLDYPDYSQAQASTETNKGLYVNATYPITEKFRATLGYRQSWDDVAVTQSGSQTAAGGQSYHKPDVKYGLEYDFADNLMVFANYSSSYRVNMAANMVHGTTTATRSIGGEKMYAYTIGAKSRLFENKVQLNASSYYYDYKNKSFQINNEGRLETSLTEADYYCKDANSNTIDDCSGLYPDFDSDGTMDSDGRGGMYEDPWKDQYGTFRTLGVDLSASWIVTNSDRVNASMSYLNAKWKQAKVHYYWSWMWDSEGLDLSDTQNTYSPTWSGSLSYQHIFMIGELGTLTPQLDAQFKSSYKLSYLSEDYFYENGLPQKTAYQEKYYLLNSSVTFNHSSGAWNLNLYLKNIMNYAVKTYLNDDNSLGLNDPRTYGAVLSVKF